jgi:hypothetical protein
MRRFYNKGAKGLSGGQVKLDKMGNNDGKISGEDFAVIRSKKMDGGMMKEAKEINSKIKNSRTLKMGGGRVKKAGGGGLYANIKAKKDRIAAGSGEKMRKVGSAGAPTAQNFINAAKTAKKV